MPIEDIHELIEILRKNGEMKRITAEVRFRIRGGRDFTSNMYENGPALLFENVKGFDMPILGNAFGSMKRLELALETQILQRLDKELQI